MPIFTVGKTLKFDAMKSPIPASESIRPIVASKVRVSDAPSVRQKTHGSLTQRRPVTRRFSEMFEKK
jgi:hypothetical protein